MSRRKIISGLLVLLAWLFFLSVSSSLEHFAILGIATDFTRGFFDDLSVVAFGAPSSSLYAITHPASIELASSE